MEVTKERERPMTKETALERGEIESARFTVKPTLVSLAGPEDSMDRFSVLVIEETSGQSARFDYMQGIGHREYDRRNAGNFGRRWTRNDYDRLKIAKLLPEGWKRLNQCSKPKPPSVAGVLSCIVMDAQSYRDLTESGEHPLDYLMSEFGYEKASEAEKIVTGLRENAHKLNRLIRKNSLTLEALETAFVNY